MPKITFILLDQQRREIDAHEGLSVMQVAVNAGLRGIAADCGGGCQCATCHVYIDNATLAFLPPANGFERDMLEGVLAPIEPGSRLSCQVRVSPACDGMIVRIPPIQ